VFFVLLLVCIYFGKRRVLGLTLAVGFLCLPQVLYLFTYVNTDSLSLVVTTLFLLQVIAMTGESRWTKATLFKLGVLITLVGLGRPNQWIVYLFGGSILSLHWLEQFLRARKLPLANLLVTVMLAVIPIVAWRVEIPRMLGVNHAVMDRIADNEARRGFRPSDPFQLTLSLREKGVPAAALAPQWMRLTIESAYARFGRFLNHVGSRMEWVFTTARWMILLLAASGVALLIVQRNRHPLWLKSLCLSVPLAGLCILWASLKHSMDTDWQPQGRYLFGLAPAAILLIGVPLSGLVNLARVVLFFFLGLGVVLSISTYLYQIDAMLV
jgi:hypothetical protein